MHIIETVFASLISNSLRASILVLGILSIQWFFRHRLTPAWRHALWLPLLAALALPAIPLFPAWSVASFTTKPQLQAPAVPVMTAAPAEMLGADVVSEPFVRKSVDAPLQLQASFEAVAQASETVAPAATESGFALKSLVAIVWVTGAIVLLVTGLLGYHRNMRRIRRSATQPDHKLQAAIAAAAEEAGLASAPLTWVSPVVSSPAVAGITRPVLLLPAAFPGELDASEVRLVLLHEFSHIKRFDLPMNWLACLLLAVHWCNPLLWFAFARMRIDREKACDARVLAIDAGGQRTQYGETLIKLQISAPSHAWSLGFIGLFERGFEIKSRIRQIAAFRPGTSLSRITGAALLTLLVGLSLLKSGQVRAESIPDALAASSEEEISQALMKPDRRSALGVIFASWIEGTTMDQETKSLLLTRLIRAKIGGAHEFLTPFASILQDDVLAAYRQSWIRAFQNSPERSRMLAGIVADPDALSDICKDWLPWEQREFMDRSKLIWAYTEPRQALEWVRQHPEDNHRMIEQAVITLSAIDPEAVERILDTSTIPVERKAAIVATAKKKARENTRAAVEWANRLLDEAEKDAAHEAIHKATPRLGASLIESKGLIKVQDILPNGPMAKAGFQNGDLLAGIEPAPGQWYGFSGVPFDQAIAQLRGEPGTQVMIIGMRRNAATGQWEEIRRNLIREQLIIDDK